MPTSGNDDLRTATERELGPSTDVEHDDAAAHGDLAPLIGRRQPNVLVVDDRDANLIAMEAVLEPLDVRVVRASSADEALRAVLVDDFAVILLDVEMPGTDGYEVARLIKQRESARITPIIFVTALSNDRRQVTSGYESGAVDYLFKPIDAELLRHKVSAFVELYQKREEEAWQQRRRYADLMESAARENEQRLRTAYESEHAARRAAEHAQARAEQAQLAAEDANRAKSNFLAIMSHELRTPLNAFQGYVQLLDMGLAGPVTEQQRDYFGRLEVSARHLLTLIDDVLDVAKVDAGRLTVARERATTGEIVAAALSLTAPQAASRGVRLVDQRGDAGVPFVGDEARVRQILVNLIGNAVKFTEPGGTVIVSCGIVSEPDQNARLAGSGPWAVIRVADSGIGISPEDMNAIFQPFHQVETGHTRTRGGTGLGLAISRQLACLMNGDLTVQSVLSHGSIFSLWLPSPELQRGAEPATTTSDVEITTRHATQPIARLAALGDLVLARMTEIVERYERALRSEPLIPQGGAMNESQLVDHGVSMIADLAQTLVIVGEAAQEATDLLRDGSAIQRTIAEQHGRRRHAQGWSLPALQRDSALLRSSILHLLQEADAALEGTNAMTVLLGMLDRNAEISARAWRQSDMRGDID